MKMTPNVGAIKVPVRIQAGAKNVANKIGDIRFGSATGNYKTNTLRESLNTAKMLFKSTKPGK